MFAGAIVAKLTAMDEQTGPESCRGLEETIVLVRKAQDGDRSAIESLFERYLPRVRQVVALRLGYAARQFAAYEDLVQDAMIRVFQKLDCFEERSEGSFRNWVAVCVGNSVRNSLRKENSARPGGGRIVSIPEREDGLATSIFRDKGPGPTTMYRGQELFDRIEEALLKLAPAEREVILLRKFCEMEYVEIAKTMAFPSEVAARKAVSRAVALLEEQVGGGRK